MRTGGAPRFSDARDAAGERLAGHIDGVQAAVGLKRLRDEFAGEFRHFIGFNHAVGIFGETQLEQPAAEAVHAALVCFHTQISGDNENVLGRPDEPRHDTGGDSACADKILSGVAQTAAVRHVGIIGNDGHALLHCLLDGGADLRRILGTDNESVHAGTNLFVHRAEQLLHGHSAQRLLGQYKRRIGDIAQCLANAADDLPVEVPIRPLRNENSRLPAICRFRRHRRLVAEFFCGTDNFFAYHRIDVGASVQHTVHRAARHTGQLCDFLYGNCH